jgi:hypothetical protein
VHLTSRAPKTGGLGDVHESQQVFEFNITGRQSISHAGFSPPFDGAIASDPDVLV